MIWQENSIKKPVSQNPFSKFQFPSNQHVTTGYNKEADWGKFNPEYSGLNSAQDGSSRHHQLTPSVSESDTVQIKLILLN